MAKFDTLFIRLASLRQEIRMVERAIADMDKPYDDEISQIENDLAKAFAVLRREANEKIEVARERKREVHESPEYSQLIGVVAKKGEEERQLVVQLEGAVLEVWEQDQKAARGLRGVRILNHVRAVYDVDRAIRWCAEHMPKAVDYKLKVREFEKHARAVKDTTPLDFVSFIEEPAIDIDTDDVDYSEMNS